MCQSVIFGSLTLISKFNLDFGDRRNFQNFLFDHVMLKFLATTEKQKLILLEDLNKNCGKVDKNHKSKTILPESSIPLELSCSRQSSEKSPTVERERENLNWEGGQLKLLTGPENETT